MSKRKRPVSPKPQEAAKNVEEHRKCRVCYGRLGGVGTAYSTKGMTTYYKCNCCSFNWSAVTTVEAVVITHKHVEVSKR